MVNEYLLFIGSGLYLATTILFLMLFIRTLSFKNGVGLRFLKVLTVGVSLGSFSVFIVRILSEYYGVGMLDARAYAIINPIILVAIGLYLNYLFNTTYKK